MTTHQDLAVPQPYHTEHRTEDVDSTPRTVDWNNPRVAAILEAAAKCFSRKGFSATTLAEIGKELGLRKSIVHYYFASKAALIHEVQSYTYHKYLERVREAVRSEPGERSARGIYALWEAAGDGNVGLNIEVWSASRNDEELKRRAASLQKEKRRLVAQSIADMLGADPSRIRESLCTLVLSVLNGLTVSEYVEGDSAKSQEAFQIFVSLLLAGLQNLDSSQQHNSAPPPPSASQPSSPPSSHPAHAVPSAYPPGYAQATQAPAPHPTMTHPHHPVHEMPHG
jgi:AcrR family transcriptional regulator